LEKTLSKWLIFKSFYFWYSSMLTLLEENLGYLPKNKTCLSNLGNRIGAVAQDVERLPTKPRPGVQSPGPQKKEAALVITIFFPLKKKNKKTYLGTGSSGSCL
jgi:hypothetical protein